MTLTSDKSHRRSAARKGGAGKAVGGGYLVLEGGMEVLIKTQG
jgi:hypothetical protein